MTTVNAIALGTVPTSLLCVVQIHYCPQPKKGESFGLPPSFLVYSEGHETANAVLNQGFTEVFKKYEKYIQSVHITDQFTGIKDDNRSAPHSTCSVCHITPSQ